RKSRNHPDSSRQPSAILRWVSSTFSDSKETHLITIRRVLLQESELIRVRVLSNRAQLLWSEARSRQSMLPYSLESESLL
ncbi:hypothetical protein PENTCL1PPCAC_30262, partial [Pristionchus entomophagus]